MVWSLPFGIGMRQHEWLDFFFFLCFVSCLQSVYTVRRKSLWISSRLRLEYLQKWKLNCQLLHKLKRCNCQQLFEYCWRSELMSIEKLKQELAQAQIYFNFWTENRHLPTAAQSADYFAGRLAKLRKAITDGEKHQHNYDSRRCCRSAKDRTE